MTVDAMTALIDATWPAASRQTTGGWVIREGKGGGSRVSAATLLRDDAQIGVAEAAMRDLGQTPLFMIRPGEAGLDGALEGRGYRIKDPTLFYTAPIAALATERPPPVTCFAAWPPLAAQAEIWDAGGIDDARIDIMRRANGPKTAFLGRMNDTPAGAAFAAIHDGTVMLHAIEVPSALRRLGMARHLIRAAAFWGQDNGGVDLSLLVTRANQGANALYASLGMQAVEGYHYRIHLEA